MEIRIEYDPREQFIPFHQRTTRWGCMVVHRRAGKTVACVNDLGAKALYTTKKDGRFGYIAPFYRQAKDVAWGYLKSFLAPAINRIRESELRVELINGAWITLYGADNPDALRGLYFDGVILDEFGDCRPSLWGQVILPTLVDRRGWAVFIGTPKGKNEFYRIYQRSRKERDRWYSLLLPASQSGLIAEEELDEVKLQMSEEQYEQEMECSFDAALPGTYYAKHIQMAEAEGRVHPIAYNAERKVSVGADLGRKDSTALWFYQEYPDGILILDFEEGQGEDAEYYIDLLIGKGYDYEDIWLPHDAKAKTLSTRRSTLEQLHDAKLPVRLAPKLDLQDGIEAVRHILPSCHFNSDCPRMEQGLDALRSYKRKFNEAAKVFLNNPDHDWASHPADGFRTLALCVKRGKNLMKVKKRPDPEIALPGTPTYNFTLDNLFRENERPRNWNKLRI